jgi:hypothetical protein
LSTTRTSFPDDKSFSVRWEPKKPAPPVMRIFLALVVLIEAGFLIMGYSRKIMGWSY